jgi:8-oxo-dGTP pyrophosphatase MutT (NUDIX family)
MRITMVDYINGNFRVLWQGSLHLKNIHWDNPISTEYTHSGQFQKEIQEHWRKHKQKYPSDYNGVSLYLYSYEFRNSQLILKVGTVNFSTITYLYKHKIHVNQGLGLVGVQSLIFSPDKSHILIGKRSQNQDYFPGALTLPGGIMEVGDYMNSASESLMREIHEEVPLEFEPHRALFAILTGWNPVSMTFLLYNTVKLSSDFDYKEVISGDIKEWEGRLTWISMEQLKEMSYDNIINGLYYYKWKIENS